jgi:hypothetical protein
VDTCGSRYHWELEGFASLVSYINVPAHFRLSQLVPISLNLILFPHSYKSVYAGRHMPVKHSEQDVGMPASLTSNLGIQHPPLPKVLPYQEKHSLALQTPLSTKQRNPRVQLPHQLPRSPRNPLDFDLTAGLDKLHPKPEDRACYKPGHWPCRSTHPTSSHNTTARPPKDTSASSRCQQRFVRCLIPSANCAQAVLESFLVGVDGRRESWERSVIEESQLIE